MNGYQFAPARSAGEADDALALATRIFTAQSGMAGYPEYKAALWKEDPAWEHGNVVIARTDDGRLVGLVRIVPRTLYRATQRFTVAGISSVCVDLDVRGKGLSEPLMNCALEHARNRGFDLALLIARRAADHYYTRFGFWGLSSYNRVRFQLEPGGGTPAQPVTLAVPRPADTDAFATAHADCYAGCFGRFERTPAYWRFLSHKLAAIPGVKWLTVAFDGAPAGYLITSGDVVHEIAHTPAVPARDLLRAVFAVLQPADGAPLAFEIPPQHRLVRDMPHTDVTVAFRECSYGGHMVRILDVDAVADAYARRAADRYRTMDAGRTEATVDGIRLVRDGESCRATVAADGSSLSYSQTCRLLGSHTLSTAPDGREGTLPFNVSFPDQL